MDTPKPVKTYKRETAWLLFGVLGAFFFVGLSLPAAQQTAEFLTAPVFMFGAAALGLDAYAKQILK